MKYTVEVVAWDREAIYVPERNKKNAVAAAKAMARQYPTRQVYISFFRASDGQKGFLNPNGYDVVGKPWVW